MHLAESKLISYSIGVINYEANAGQTDAMNTEQNAWAEIRSNLAAIEDDALQGLIDSSSMSFDGHYNLSADPLVYSGLCQYYPLVETVVQDVTGKHLRLNLRNSVPMGTDESDLAFELGSANVSDAILSPESIAAIPSYLLRFVPYVGSGAVLIATALRQAFYRASRERGADQLYPKSGDAVTIDVNSLLNSLGHVMSRAKFFRIFKEGGLEWFVERAPAAHHFKDGQIRRQPNTYRYRGMILTPGDAEDLYRWLVANAITSDPVGVLGRAAAAPRDQVLTFPFRLPEGEAEATFASAASVHEVVMTALGVRKLEPTVAGLCDRLSSHLVRPESFLGVPWYWFHKVLPELGDDLGMLYLMCKNCCYIDWARGRDRNTFWVPGGLPTLQGWIRSESLPKRIPHAESSRRGRPREEVVNADSQYTRDWRKENRQLAGQYLRRVATRPSDLGTDWQLKVAEVQLTAADETFKQAIYAFLYAPPGRVSSETLHTFAEDTDIQNLFSQAARHDPLRICNFETLAVEGICQIDTLPLRAIYPFDTLAEGLNSYFETLIAAGICQFDTIIKILIKLRHTAFFKQDNPTPYTYPEPEVEQVISTDWNFESLLGKVSPILRSKITARNLGRAFLSWLIQASLTPSIHSPLSLAVTRVLESGSGAGGAAERLATGDAGEVANAITSALARLEGGYLGALPASTPVARDLLSLLPAGAGPAEQSRLLRRLADELGL